MIGGRVNHARVALVIGENEPFNIPYIVYHIYLNWQVGGQGLFRELQGVCFSILPDMRCRPSMLWLFQFDCELSSRK